MRGIGAKITIFYGENNALHQMRELKASGGYMLPSPILDWDAISRSIVSASAGLQGRRHSSTAPLRRQNATASVVRSKHEELSLRPAVVICLFAVWPYGRMNVFVL